MSSATTSQNQNVSDTASAHSPRGLADFPTEIVRLVFEESVAPRSLANDDHQRQRSAYACCLVSKKVKAWIEPILYAKVVLESSKQVMAFLDTLESKSAEFLTRTVKTVWILNDSFPDDAVDRFHLLFSRCLSLESLACIGSEPCICILQNIPKPRDGPYRLRELTIMQPDITTAYQFSLRYLSIQKLQLINSDGYFVNTLCERLDKNEELLDTLRAIPRIYFDSIQVPKYFFTTWIRSTFLPMILLKAPGADNRIYMRVSRMSCHRRKVRILEMWVRNFDEYVQQYGHRLFVSDVETNHNATDLERSKAWIGLD